jgi:phytoene dehydrogenase-like protein
MAKKIIIIGGGIAGLSAGCYGRMNGYDTRIMEMHTAPGGVCTGWVRKGYTFDGCLHWLTGSAPGNGFYTVWNELGVLPRTPIIDHDVFCDYVTASGARVRQHTDVERFIQTLLALAPEDRVFIERLRADALLLGSRQMPLDPPPRPGPLKMLLKMRKIRPFMEINKRLGSLSMEEYTRDLRSDTLREVLRLVMPLPDFPSIRVVSLLSMLNGKAAGWPVGGSLALARSIEKRYRDLGGAIQYGARVVEVVASGGRATGVRLADGGFHEADEVIGAADGRSTIFGMLGGRFVSPALKNAYETLPLYTPFMQVSFGVNRDLHDGPRLATYAFARPLAVGGSSVSWLFLNNYGFDPTMAPPGKTALTVNFWASYDYWERLSHDREAYRAEKERAATDVLAWLDTVHPGISREVEVTDVATPMTTVRYTGNYRGSYEGWRPTAKTHRMKLDRTLPGLEGFSMIGQWASGLAGLPTAANDGRRAIRGLCERDGREFVTTTA